MRISIHYTEAVVSMTQQLKTPYYNVLLVFQWTGLKNRLPPSSWFQGSLWQDDERPPLRFSTTTIRRNRTVPCPNSVVTIFIASGSDLGVQPSRVPIKTKRGIKRPPILLWSWWKTSCSDRCAAPQSPQQEVAKAFQVFMAFAQRGRSPTYTSHSI